MVLGGCISIYRRFAPNVSEVSDDFQRLAIQFRDGGLHQYAALCYIGASKCEKSLGNTILEVDLLVRAARAYIKADSISVRLCLRSNEQQFLNGAMDCYNNAIELLEDSSIMKASIIREMKAINPNYERTSDFVSPAHRAYDLDVAADECIRDKHFESAFEKLTEIRDDIIERKKENIYHDILRKHEITLIFLILLLDLPKSRQSPSNIKLYENFSNGHSESTNRHSPEKIEAIQSLIKAFEAREYIFIIEIEIPSLMSFPGITCSQQIVLNSLKEKCRNLV